MQKKFDVSIIAFCVMNNHVHICLYYEEIQNVSKFMHMINSIYANYYNYSENRVGYVFRNRYYSKEIKDRNQLFNTIVYIHKNHLKAELVYKMNDWEYSTYNDYINREIDKKIIMIVFDTEENKKTSNEIIEEYLAEANIPLETIYKNRKLLIELVRKMKYNGKILNKEIANKLNINKNTVTRILKMK